MPVRPKSQNIFKQLKRAAAHPICYRAKVRVTLAELNAAGGAILVPAAVGGGVRLHDIKLTTTSGTAAGSNVIVTGMQGKVATTLVSITPATLVTTAVIGPGTAGVTLTGIFINLCDVAQPIRLSKDGANITGIGGLDVSVLYSIE